MKIAKKLLVVLPLLAVALVGSSKAHAKRTIYLEYPGITFIGIESVYGNAVAGLSDDSGKTCTWYQLGWGGLDQSTLIIGSSGNDYIMVNPEEMSPRSWCGVDLYELNTNNNPLVIDGGDGDDSIINFGPDVVIGGEDGNDNLADFISPNYNNHTTGGTGSDLFFLLDGNHASGNEGDDLFCNLAEGVAYISGGNGWDYRVGFQAEAETSIEVFYGSEYVNYCWNWFYEYFGWILYGWLFR